MATIKNVKIQKNKILTYAVNKSGFKTVYGSVLVNQNQTININMKNLDDVSEPFELGDRLFGISSFVDYFTPSGTYDVDSLKYLKISQTTGTSLTNLAVVKSTWLSQVETTLGIETPKGTSNDFIFTYDGSKWDLTGATTQNNVDLEDYGISFDGTPAENDVITVTETQYNKFAFFVLDSNYRGWYGWNNVILYNTICTPVQYTTTSNFNVNESATYINNYIFETQNLSTFNGFGFVKNIGTFLLGNIKITSLIPNLSELKTIYNNRVVLDNSDPTITASGQQKSLTLWKWNNLGNGYDKYALSCTENTGENYCAFNSANTNYWSGYLKWKAWYGGDDMGGGGLIPIFEVPVM